MKVKWGLKNVHYSKATVTDGVVSYAVPVPITGAVQMSFSPVNEEIKHEADNEEDFWKQVINKGYNGTLEMTRFPTDFKKNILGYKADANGVVFEDPDAEPSDFALLFEIETDIEPIRYALYRCAGGRPNIDPATSSNKTPKNEQLPIATSRFPGALPFGYAEKDLAPVAYEAWYTQVQTYVAPAEG
jgi:phi13 family phage major tail protein